MGPDPNLDCKLEIEDHVRNLPITTTIIRPSTFMELLMIPDFWTGGRILSFFASPDQPVEYIAAEDIGRIVAGILASPAQFAGQAIDIAGDQVTGHDIEAAIAAATGYSVSYQRFADTMLGELPTLARTVQLFDEGRVTDNAGIPALSRQFDGLARLDDWIAGTGKKSLEHIFERR